MMTCDTESVASACLWLTKHANHTVSHHRQRCPPAHTKHERPNTPEKPNMAALLHLHQTSPVLERFNMQFTRHFTNLFISGSVISSQWSLRRWAAVSGKAAVQEQEQEQDRTCKASIRACSCSRSSRSWHRSSRLRICSCSWFLSSSSSSTTERNPSAAAGRHS